MKTKPIRRRVVCVYGKWGKKTDFVIEPAIEGDGSEDVGKVFWIEEVKEKNK